MRSTLFFVFLIVEFDSYLLFEVSLQVDSIYFIRGCSGNKFDLFIFTVGETFLFCSKSLDDCSFSELFACSDCLNASESIISSDLLFILLKN